MQPAVGAQPAPSSTPTAGAGQQSAFTSGRAIARTFSTWWHHAPAFALLSLVAALPLWGAVLLGGLSVPGMTAPGVNPLAPAAAGAPPGMAALPAGFWLGYLGTMLLFLVEVGAITHGVIHHLAGKPEPLGAMVAAGARRALPVLLAGLVTYVIVLAGTMLLLVPGVYLACALAPVIPVVVVERRGVFGAITRSFALTKGKRLSVFVVFLVLLAVMTGAAIFGGVLLPRLMASSSPVAGGLVGAAVNLVFGTIFWVAPGVVYHDLRVAKEGVAAARLATVFE